MTADQVSRILDCACGAEACMRMEALAVLREDYLAAAAWADTAEHWSAEAFRLAVQA